ncbi:MAG: lipopolysaccharide transport periplasmic protein LptA [Nitrospiria bacterium]
MSEHWFIKSRKVLILSLFFILGMGIKTLAAETPSAQKPDGPISIQSQNMTLKNIENKAVFDGAVHILQGDLSIKSDHAEVFMVTQKEGVSLLKDTEAKRDVSKIVTTGNVTIENGKQRAKAEKGVYDRQKNIIILTGKPEVWEDGYHVKGKEITFFIAEEKTLVVESQVVIHNAPKVTKKKQVLN